jgi:hypothetical protein
MPGDSFRGAAPALDEPARQLADALRADVDKLAVGIGERNVTKQPAALLAAASFLELQLKAAGYDVQKERFDAQRFAARYGPGIAAPHPVENLVVERRGKSRPQEIVVVGAHYDSAEGTPGADDNASGVAAALALARRLSVKQPERTVRFVFFVNEEPPWFEGEHMGSEVNAGNARRRGDDIVAMLSLETIGYFDDKDGSQRYPFPFSLFYPSTGNFIAFVADTDSKALVHEVVRVFRGAASVPSEGAALPASVPGVDWSDHAPFWRHGYRAVMVTDTAPNRNPHYHEPTDVPARLDIERLTRAVLGLEVVIDDLATRADRP